MTDEEFRALPLKERRWRLATARKMLKAWMLSETRKQALTRCANNNDPPCFTPCDGCWRDAHAVLVRAMWKVLD